MAFKSTSYYAAQAIRQVMREQEEREERELLKRIADEERLAEKKEREEAAAQRRRQIELSEADRLLKITSPDEDLTDDAAARLEAGDIPVTRRQTLPARTIAISASEQGPAIEGRSLPSTGFARRGETFLEKQAREEIERTEAERDEARTFRNDQARANEEFRRSESSLNRSASAEQKEADRELRAMIAAAQAQNTTSSRALADELKRIQIATAADKLETTQKERATTAKNIATDRANMRELVDRVLNADNLAEITGSFEGRRSTFAKEKNTALLALFEQIKNSLKLDARQKLRGQGTITDSETEMLGKAVSALDRASGTAETKRLLKQIRDAFEGDAPGARGGSVSDDFVVTVE
jgi:hypothetical protein